MAATGRIVKPVNSGIVGAGVGGVDFVSLVGVANGCEDCSLLEVGPVERVGEIAAVDVGELVGALVCVMVGVGEGGVKGCMVGIASVFADVKKGIKVTVPKLKSRLLSKMD